MKDSLFQTAVLGAHPCLSCQLITPLMMQDDALLQAYPATSLKLSVATVQSRNKANLLEQSICWATLVEIDPILIDLSRHPTHQLPSMQALSKHNMTILRSPLQGLKRALCTTAHEKPRTSYITQKVKDEMAALAAEDGTRWTATTLAARFGAPAENVAALLALRRMRPKQEPEKLRQVRDDVGRAWAGLVEVPGRRGGMLARAAEVVGEVDMDGETGDEVVVEEEVVEREKSGTMRLVEELCARGAEKDVVRNTSFAFIEVGSGDVERAVWVREGSGELRLASESERKVLLKGGRADECEAWNNNSK